MDMSFMMIFDVIIGILGIYLVFTGIRCAKKGTVDYMIVTADEMARCSDEAGLSQYLMPKTAIFGGFCIIFAIQGLCNDMGWVEFSQLVNTIFLVAFILVWIVFSYFIKTGKSKYIH